MLANVINCPWQIQIHNLQSFAVKCSSDLLLCRLFFGSFGVMAGGRKIAPTLRCGPWKFPPLLPDLKHVCSKTRKAIYIFFFPTACAHIVLALWCTGIDHWPSSRNWYANKIRIKLKVCWPEGSRHAKFMILMDFFYNVKHTKLCINRTQWPHATAPTSQLSYLIVPVSVVLWCSKSLRVQRSGPYACDTAIFQPKAVRPHLCLVVVAIFKKYD